MTDKRGRAVEKGQAAVEQQQATFTERVQAALTVLDYSDPESLRAAAAHIKTAREAAERMLDRKERERDAIRAGIRQLAEVEAKLRGEARYLQSRSDFDDATASQREGVGGPQVPAG